jgi:branched-subunit amino acid aminotransferase/4-amino-4-deoxychorismate lyase
MTKAVADEFAPWLGVFETLRVIEGVPLFVPEHLTALKRSARALGLKTRLDVEKARAALPRLSGRWRWIVAAEGTRSLFTEEVYSAPGPVALSISPLRLGSQNWDARFKTLSYLTHAQALKIAPTPEVILLNEHRQVASAARYNLFWRRGDRLFTPSHASGCRAGVVRDFVKQRRDVKEGEFDPDDLLGADEIFLTNSMRGIVSVNAIEGDLRSDFSEAEGLRMEYEEAVAKQVNA